MGIPMDSQEASPAGGFDLRPTVVRRGLATVVVRNGTTGTANKQTNELHSIIPITVQFLNMIRC